jgi:MFS family permease
VLLTTLLKQNFLTGMADRVKGNFSRQFLNGATISSFSIGRMLGSTVWGHLSSIMSDKIILITSSLLAILGSALYLLAYSFPNPWLLIFSRLTHGIAAGVLSIARSHTSKITTLKQRTRYLALNGAAQYASLGIAPFLPLLLVRNSESQHWNSFTAPAFLIIITNVINLGLSALLFCNVECERAQSARILLPASRGSEKLERKVVAGIFLYMFLNFSSRSVFSLVETLTVGIYADFKHITGEVAKALAASKLFGFLGLGGLLMFLITLFLVKCLKENTILLLSLITISSGSTVLLCSFSESSLPLFFLGVILIWSIALPPKQTTLVSSFSKLLGSRPQGPLMGWLGTCGSLGRVLMPLLAGILDKYQIFSLASVISLLSVCALGSYMYWIKTERSDSVG